MRKMSILIVIAGILLSLEGCVPLAIGGGVAAGSAYYANRDRIHRYMADNKITNEADRRLKATAALQKGTHVFVVTKNRNVLLLGETPLASQRIKAEQVVHSVPGVKQVYNEIKISGPTSMLTRTSDSLITSKVKSKMTLTKNLPSRDIVIATEGGTVYLMGSLTQKQEQLAINLARRVGGVQKVVTLIENK